MSGSCVESCLAGRSQRRVLTILVFFLLGCRGERHRQVVKQMTWACVPAPHDPQLADAETEAVMFRYAEAPEYYDVVLGRQLCQQLRATGKSTAAVTFDVHGYPGHSLRGYRIELINGAPWEFGGAGYSGAQDQDGIHPLEKEFRGW